MDLDLLRSTAATCDLCNLHEGRLNPVFDKGNPKASIFICGMVPAKDENAAGLPFVGRAGKLLDSILEKADLNYDQVYITNLVKCFLAAGKSLKQEWIDACFPYLISQISLLRPRLIITLGKDATAALMAEEPKSLAAVNGVMVNYSKDIGILPTYHPSYLLRTGAQASPKFNEVVKHFQRARNICYF